MADGVGAREVLAREAPSRARQFVMPGDTLLSCVRVNLRRVILVEPNSSDVASTAFAVLRPRADLVDPSYLFHWATTDAFVEALLPLQRGNQPPAVVDDDVRRQMIPVPPLDTQRKIAGRISELFDEIHDGDEELRRARQELETYRKSLLKAAVTGELTTDWRASNQPNETGEQLLKRLLDDRRARWEADPNNKGKKYKEPPKADIDDMPSLPEGWAWATTDMLSDAGKGHIVIGPFGSDLKVSDYRDEGVPLVFVRHIRSRIYDNLNPQFVSVEKARALKSHVVRPGDILITKMGDPPGDADIYPSDQPDGIITADCIRWRPAAGVDRGFCLHWINSMLGRRWIQRKTKGVAQQKISLETFKQLPVPVPSCEEAGITIEFLDAGLSPCSTDARSTEALEEMSDSLRRSILAAAFRGELVL